MGKTVKTRAGLLNPGYFVRLKGENFWRRVNSDGTLTKVEDGLNGTYDFRNKTVPEKVKKNTSWRIALANSINPINDYPSGALHGYNLYKRVKNKQKSKNITIRERLIRPLLGDSVSEAAWRKYLGLNYDSKFLPKGVPDNRTNYGNNTVRLPILLELEIPVDTFFIRNRINKNKEYLNNKTPKSDNVISTLKDIINKDEELLEKLKYTYKTGKPVGISEYDYNSRLLIKEGEVLYPITPLNVLGLYNIRYDKGTNRMYYSDEYGFDNSNPWPINWMGGYDKFLEGQPFRYRGYIDLNKFGGILNPNKSKNP